MPGLGGKNLTPVTVVVAPLNCITTVPLVVGATSQGVWKVTCCLPLVLLIW